MRVLTKTQYNNLPELPANSVRFSSVDESVWYKSPRQNKYYIVRQKRLVPNGKMFTLHYEEVRVIPG